MNLCAERVAALNMYVNSGETVIKRLIAFRGSAPDGGSSGMPCGACREFLVQLDEKNKNTEIMVDFASRKTITLGELLPAWWGDERYTAAANQKSDDNDLILVRPSMEYEKELLSYKADFLANSDSMDGCGPLRRHDNIKDYIAEAESYTKKETLPEGKVIATQFLCVRKSDGRVVGMIQVRHYLNDYLKKYAGHIGYSVRPSERRHGYAKWMLRHALDYCRELGIDKAMVTCVDTNEASRRTILACGGKYDSYVYEPDEKKNLERYYIDLSHED